MRRTEKIFLIIMTITLIKVLFPRDNQNDTYQLKEENTQWESTIDFY